MRKAEIERVTKETQIKVSVSLDEKGKADIDTGIGSNTVNYDVSH